MSSITSSLGNVNFYNNKKGMGMIIGKDDKLYFFHRSETEYESFQEGDQVSFLVKEGQVKGKLTAYNVKLV